jgi:hypothetical protein
LLIAVTTPLWLMIATFSSSMLHFTVQRFESAGETA